MKYIAPEMEMKSLEVEDILMSEVGDDNSGNNNQGGNMGEFDDEEV